MKKMLLVMAAGVFVAAGTAQAQSETVTSVNVVGYYSVTLPPAKLLMLSAPLLSFEGATLADMFGDQLPDGTKVYIWDRSKTPAQYSSASYQSTPPFVPTPVWGGSYTNVLLPGDGFFLKTPNSGITNTVTIMGEVPAIENDYGTNVVSNLSGLNIVSYSFPVDVVFTNTTLAADSDVQVIYLWNEQTQTYSTYARQAAGFPPVPFSGNWPAGSPTIPAGRAFWVKTATSLDWTEVAPYLNNL